MNKTNILLITTDQQRYDTICAAGFDHMITPNLDALAHDGCIFTNAYSPNPVCLPARHNILTGLSAKYHTFDDNYFDDSHQIPYQLPTFSQCLSDDGYDTIAIGKMHFQPYRRHNGFHRLHLMDEIPRFREDDDYALYLKENGYDHLQSIHGVRHLLYMQPQQSLVDEKHHGSAWVATKTIDYLKTKSINKPFLIWSSFISPHPPFDVPAAYADLYKDVKLPELVKSKTPISTLAEENKNIGNYQDEKTLQRARELYFASITFVDKQIGRIIQELKDQNLYDNTCIIFTSDHGEMLGDHETFQKFLPYDFSSKVPMIIKCKDRIKPNTTCDDLVDLNDLFPTFMDIANLSMHTDYDYPGSSLLRNDKDRTYQYIEHQRNNRRWVSLRNKEYKYNYYYGGQKEELFDLVNDKHETENLLYTQPDKYTQIRNELRQKLVEYESRYGLEGMIEDNDFKKFDDFEIFFYRENNPPYFPKVLNNQPEKDKLLSLEEELELALQNEPLVDLDKLDIDYFKDTLDTDKIREISKRRKN